VTVPIRVKQHRSRPARPTADVARRRAQGLSTAALERAHAYIAAHLCESFGLDDIARAACISRFHFARLFRASTGSSPMEYVLKLRMDAAKQMLASGHQKIATTAAALGFFDQSHFTRTFRRMTGLSPRAYSRLPGASLASEPAVHSPSLRAPS
jgi:AraC family transcriptional regulator